MNISGGWSKSPHFIHDAMPAMSGAEYKCTAVLVRETYGYHRPRARLTYQDFMQQTGIKGKATIARALKEIEARGFFRRTGSPSEWEICHSPEPEDDPGGQADEADESLNRSDYGATGSISEAKRARSGDSGRFRRSDSDLDSSAAELQRCMNELIRSNAELNRSNAELNHLLTELICSIAVPGGSLNEPAAAINGSTFETEGQANGIDCPKSEPAPGSRIEPQNSPKSSKFVPLQLYKDKDTPSGKEREGEDDKRLPRPRARGQTAGQIFGPSRDGRKISANSRANAAGKAPPHPGIPRPRTAEEAELAWHPAAAVWLEAGMGWPGWERLQKITQRMGRQPRVETLRKARGMWLMAGYRMSNIEGILDWYESVCHDENWRPFPRTRGQNGRTQGGVNAPDPTMAMLLEMQKELTHGKRSSDHAMFDSAQVSLPAGGVWPSFGDSVPNGAGGYRPAAAASSSIAACFDLEVVPDHR